jgi:uncharacterized protein (TIGR02246 family)
MFASIDVEQQRMAVMEQDRAWSESTKDPQKFLSFFAPDASVYPPGMPIATGTEAINTMWGQMTVMPGFSIRWTANKADVAGSADLAYTAGTYEMTVSSPDLGLIKDVGKYVTTWKKQRDGQWKVVADIFNSDAPPPRLQPKLPNQT